MNDPILAKDPVPAGILRRLVDVYQPERIYMFGSKARGDDGADSDYPDLLVVVPDDASPERKAEPRGLRGPAGDRGFGRRHRLDEIELRAPGRRGDLSSGQRAPGGEARLWPLTRS